MDSRKLDAIGDALSGLSSRMDAYAARGDAMVMKPYIGKYGKDWELIGRDGKVKATAPKESDLHAKLKEELKLWAAES